MSSRYFASDNAAGIHPRVLAAIVEANSGHALAYGDDDWTRRAAEALRTAFDADAEVLFAFGGTGANVLGLAAVMRRHQSVLCADSAHLWTSECAAPEQAFGGKVVPLPHRQGKLTVALLEPALGPTRGVHHAQPRVVSVSQPTEWGTLYTPAEISELAEFIHSRGLLLHVDGARFANAAAALGQPLSALGRACGIDILTFGGTKNGLMGGEAVLFFDRALAHEAAYARKQATQLASKMRFISAQFLAYLEGDLWRELALQANAMATRLAGALDTLPAVEFLCPVQCNMLFPRLPPHALASLREDYHFYAWDEQASIARWLTAFDTTAADVDAFAAAVRAACAVR